MITVTGASGANGTALLKLLSSHGVAARAMVRHPERADDIRLPHIEIVQGDFDRPETVRAALQGADKAFLLAPSSQNVEEQQKTFVKCAQESGVRHLVKLSQLGADADSSQRFLRYHGAVEDAIRASDLAFRNRVASRRSHEIMRRRSSEKSRITRKRATRNCPMNLIF